MFGSRAIATPKVNVSIVQNRIDNIFWDSFVAFRLTSDGKARFEEQMLNEIIETEEGQTRRENVRLLLRLHIKS